MANNDQSTTPKVRAFNFKWALPLFLKPRKTTAEIVAGDKPQWLTPMIILSVLVILFTLFAAPIRKEAIQMGLNTPENFQYFSAEQQAQFLDAQAKQTSPLFLYVFPILTSWIGIWASWFILSSILHLILTLSGSRAVSIKSYNLSSWSFLPIGVRYLVQIMAMIFTHTVISKPGLSGFVAADATGLTAYFGAFIGLIDIYFAFQVFLLFIGSIPLSGLSKTKALTATAIAVVVLMLLQALPGFISSMLSGLSLSGGFYI